MTKTVLHLFVDKELSTMARAKGINLSQLFRNMLKTELGLKDDGDQRSKDDIIRELEIKIAKLSSALEDKDKEIEKLKREKGKVIHYSDFA